jgi:hypothetical protein
MEVASMNIAAARQFEIVFIAPPAFLRSRMHREFHVHAFMFLTTDDCAHHLVVSGVSGSRHQKFLLAGLQQQIPPVHLGSVLGSQQGEAVD